MANAPSNLIILLQKAKIEMEKHKMTNRTAYRAISEEIYYLEGKESLPVNWRDSLDESL